MIKMLLLVSISFLLCDCDPIITTPQPPLANDNIPFGIDIPGHYAAASTNNHYPMYAASGRVYWVDFYVISLHHFSGSNGLQTQDFDEITAAIIDLVNLIHSLSPDPNRLLISYVSDHSLNSVNFSDLVNLASSILHDRLVQAYGYDFAINQTVNGLAAEGQGLIYGKEICVDQSQFLPWSGNLIAKETQLGFPGNDPGYHSGSHGIGAFSVYPPKSSMRYPIIIWYGWGDKRLIGQQAQEVIDKSTYFCASHNYSSPPIIVGDFNAGSGDLKDPRTIVMNQNASYITYNFLDDNGITWFPNGNLIEFAMMFNVSPLGGYYLKPTAIIYNKTDPVSLDYGVNASHIVHNVLGFKLAQ